MAEKSNGTDRGSDAILRDIPDWMLANDHGSGLKPKGGAHAAHAHDGTVQVGHLQG